MTRRHHTPGRRHLWRTITTAAAVTALAGTLWTAGPANAATVTVTDRRGDASASTLDLLDGAYTNADTYVAFRWHVARLGPGVNYTGTTLEDCGGCAGAYYQVIVRKTATGVTATLRTPHDSILHRVPCPGLTHSWQPARGIITARVPKRCIIGPTTLYMQEYATRVGNSMDYDTMPVRRVARG